MNAQIRTISCALCLFMLTFSGYSQNGLSVSSGTSLSVLPGTFFSVDSLVLVPSAKFIINGANKETRTPGTIHPLANAYISRVFHFAATLTAYNGKITIYYRDAELKGIPEANLTLNVHDGSNWKAYTSNITRNGTENFVSTSGLNNISLNELTLANGNPSNAPIAGLTIGTTNMKEQLNENQVLHVKALPNPASDYFTLIINGSSFKAVTLRIADVLGRVVESKTNIAANCSLRIGDKYQPGVYFAEVVQGAQRVTVKLIKQPD
jgi:hypothetical protein